MLILERDIFIHLKGVPSHFSLRKFLKKIHHAVKRMISTQGRSTIEATNRQQKVISQQTLGVIRHKRALKEFFFLTPFPSSVVSIFFLEKKKKPLQILFAILLQCQKAKRESSITGSENAPFFGISNSISASLQNFNTRFLSS